MWHYYSLHESIAVLHELVAQCGGQGGGPCSKTAFYREGRLPQDTGKVIERLSVEFSRRTVHHLIISKSENA